MLPPEAEFGLAVSGHRNISLRPQSFKLFQRTGMDAITQTAKAFEGLTRPFGNAFWIFQSPRHGRALLSGLHRQNKFDAFYLGELSYRGGNGRRGSISIDRALFVESLSGFQKETIVGFKDCPGPVGFRRERFESARAPGKNSMKSR